MEYRTTDIRAGLFIALSLLAGTVLVFTMSGVRGAFRDSVELRILFDQVRLIEIDAPVTVGGFRVGEVRDIRQVETETDGERRFRVELTVAVDRSLSVFDDAVAMVRQDGFLGPKFVALSPGVSGRPIAAGAAIPGRAEPVLADLVGKFEEPLARLNGVLGELEKLIGETTLLDDVDAVAIEARGLVRDLRGSALPKAERLIEDLDANVVRLGDRADASLAEVVDATKSLVSIVDARAERIDAVLAEARGLLADARVAVDRVAGGAEAATGGVADAAGEAERLLADNNRNVYLTIRNLRDATAELETLIRKIRSDPSVLVWGDDEPVEAPREPPDLEALREAGRAERYGKEPGK